MPNARPPQFIRVRNAEITASGVKGELAIMARRAYHKPRRADNFLGQRNDGMGR